MDPVNYDVWISTYHDSLDRINQRIRQVKQEPVCAKRKGHLAQLREFRRNCLYALNMLSQYREV